MITFLRNAFTYFKHRAERREAERIAAEHLAAEQAAAKQQAAAEEAARRAAAEQQRIAEEKAAQRRADRAAAAASRREEIARRNAVPNYLKQLDRWEHREKKPKSDPNHIPITRKPWKFGGGAFETNRRRH